MPVKMGAVERKIDRLKVPPNMLSSYRRKAYRELHGQPQ